MDYLIDTVKFYSFLMREYRQCTALEDQFAKEYNYQKAAEYAEDACVYASILDAFEEHNAPLYDWLVPENNAGMAFWHDLRIDPDDLPKENEMMAVVIQTPSGQEQLMWRSKKLPGGAVKWCSIPDGREA